MYDELSHMKARIMFNQVHTKNNGINLYELNVFSSLDNILDYIKTGKIEEVYEKNLCTMPIVPIKTNWQGWSITELHETDDPKVFTASPKDVWKFKYNI